jgi:hypothetical protein
LSLIPNAYQPGQRSRLCAREMVKAFSSEVETPSSSENAANERRRDSV